MRLQHSVENDYCMYHAFVFKHTTYGNTCEEYFFTGIFAVPKRMCAAMYLKGIFEFSKRGHLDSLKEFHIIDIHNEVLDMINDWYTKYKKDPACLEIGAVLKSCESDHRRAFTRQSSGHHDERRNKKISDNLSESQRRKGQVGKEVMHARATYPRPSTTKVVPKFCGKTDILIYTGNVLQLEGIDVVVVSEDGLVKGEGGLSKALLNAGCDKYRKEHKKLKPVVKIWFLEHNQGTVLLTTGGDKLPFRHVLHAIIRRQNGEQEQVFQKKLQSTMYKVLLQANLLNFKSKKGINIALPMIGLGNVFHIKILYFQTKTILVKSSIYIMYSFSSIPVCFQRDIF